MVQCGVTKKKSLTTVKASEAYIIARADEFVDDYPDTQPVTLYIDPKRRFHFRVSGSESVKRGAGSEVVQAGIDAGDPVLTGIGLHAFQDSYSHEGFGPDKGHLGTAYGSHAPDYPWTDVEKAMAMAEQTYNFLVSYMKNKPSQ